MLSLYCILSNKFINLIRLGNQLMNKSRPQFDINIISSLAIWQLNAAEHRGFYFLLL